MMPSTMLLRTEQAHAQLVPRRKMSVYPRAQRDRTMPVATKDDVIPSRPTTTTQQRSPPPTFFLCLLITLLSRKHPLVDAAHAARTRVASSPGTQVSYDRSITTFNEEGRLLQVEYGMEAALLRGSTLVALHVGRILGNHDHDDSSQEDDETEEDRKAQDAVYLVTRHSSSSVTPTHHPPILTKVYRIDDHIVLTAAGLVGDARFLVDQLRDYCQAARTHYGEAPTVHDVAQKTAEWHHTLTRLEGARPLATTCLIVGVDAATTTQDNDGRARIFRTGPGGSVEEYRYCALGRDQDSIMKALAGTIMKVLSVQKSTQKNQLSSKKVSRPDPVVSLLRGTFQAMNLPKNEIVDVWRIRSATGNLEEGSKDHDPRMEATCFRGVTLDNLEQLSVS